MPALTHGRVKNGFNSLPRNITSIQNSGCVNGKCQKSNCCGKAIQPLKYRPGRNQTLLRVSTGSSNKKYNRNVAVGRSFASKRAIARRAQVKKPVQDSAGQSFKNSAGEKTFECCEILPTVTFSKPVQAHN